MEEVKALFLFEATTFGRWFTLAIAATIFFTSDMAGQEHRPRIKSSVLCGDVTDLAGSPVAKASVAAMLADVGTGVKTGQLGRWSFGPDTGQHWVRVEADGYETFIFDYVDEANSKDKGANKPAFIVRPKDNGCPAPIHVRSLREGPRPVR